MLTDWEGDARLIFLLELKNNYGHRHVTHESLARRRTVP